MMERVPIHIAEARGKDFFVGAQELVTGRTAVISQTGAGKSWTIGVMCEKLCRNNIGFCIIDTEGEYFSLKEKFQVLWVGKDPSCDVNVERVEFGELASTVLRENVPMIFDVSDVIDQRAAVAAICGALYETETKLRVPYLLIVEEADKFAPQRDGVLKEIDEISRRGRKRGLGLLVATQRPAFLNKNVLSQCDNQLIGKLTTEADLSAVSLFFASRAELRSIPKLKPGEFFALGNIVERKTRIRVIQRETTHKGLTPRLLPKPIGKISEIKERITASVAMPLAAPAAAPPVIIPTEVKLRAFSPEISREQVMKMAEAEKRKKFGLFGPKEMLMGTELRYRHLVFVEVKYLGGVLRKSVRTSSFILDGLTGALAEIEKGFASKHGFEDLLGLGETAARVLLEICRSGRATVADLEAKTGFSEGTVRAVIEGLSEAKLITYTRVGRAKVYLPFRKIVPPELERRVSFELPAETSISGAAECRFSERDMRDVLKAIEPTCEITAFEPFYYPIYEVRFAKRKIEIDGLKGKICAG